MEPQTLDRLSLGEVVTLLAASLLPHDDLTEAHLADFLGVYAGDRLVGVVGLERRGADGLLRSLAVAPPHRGRGLAAQLVEALEARARAHGVRDLYLLTTTAEAFFARRGYERADRAAVPEALRQTPEFASICPSTAVCMKKQLA
jgi:amino-acid N-acetyltransferase